MTPRVMALSFLLISFVALTLVHIANAKTEPDRTIAKSVMALCSPYQEAKKEHDMKCTRELTDGLKNISQDAKKLVETADSKAICTGDEKEGSRFRFTSACGVIAHLCDFMQLGELYMCPAAEPLVKKKKQHVAKQHTQKSVSKTHF